MLKGDEMYEGHIMGHNNEEGNKHLIRESQDKEKMKKRERRYTPRDYG